MIVFLYGSDTYRLKQAREEIISRYKNKYPSGMNLFSLDLLEPADIDILENALKSNSFFNEHKLIVCKNVFNKKVTAELIVRHIKEYNLAKSDDITLIISENMAGKELLAKHKELFGILNDKKNLIKEIEPFQGEKLYSWIQNEFESRECSIEPNAVRNLVNMTGGDTWAIINEIEKLTGYKPGKITPDDVARLVAPKIDLSIFDLIDALGNKDRRKSIELLYKELKTGRDPYYILTMIIYQFRNLLTIKDLQKRGLTGLEISRKAKLNPFVVKKNTEQAKNFDLNVLKKIYENLLEIDVGVKRGNVKLEDCLYGFITN